MVDFTSSLYLGIRHASRSLEPWAQLTTGKPAALGTPPRATAVAQALAALQGCERATLLSSTLHLFFDLFEFLRRDDVRLYIDAGAYPIARWAAQRVVALGVPVRRLPHFDAEAAGAIIAADAGSGRRPVIVADGFCPACGRPAPLPQYLRQARRHRGYVVLDDTQALGVWGAQPRPDDPYGRGGGGSLRRHGIGSRHIILGSSLAKGFGAPLAVLSGSAALLRRFERSSKTAVHTSPPSAAAVNAAAHALAVNARCGNALRRCLAGRNTDFHHRIRKLLPHMPATLFPVQSLDCGPDPLRVQQLLETHGVETIVTRGCDRRDKLVFVFTACHTSRDIDRAATALEFALALRPSNRHPRSSEFDDAVPKRNSGNVIRSHDGRIERLTL